MALVGVELYELAFFILLSPIKNQLTILSGTSEEISHEGKMSVTRLLRKSKNEMCRFYLFGKSNLSQHI